MNPIKWIYGQIASLFKFLAHDFYTDGKAIVKLVKHGEDSFDPEKLRILKKEMKSLTIGSFLKESWHWVLVVLVTLAVGLLLGARYSEIQCNNFIIEAYIKPSMQNMSDTVLMALNYSF